MMTGLLDIPADVIRHYIFSRMTIDDMVSLSKTCVRLRCILPKYGIYEFLFYMNKKIHEQSHDGMDFSYSFEHICNAYDPTRKTVLIRKSMMYPGANAPYFLASDDAQLLNLATFTPHKTLLEFKNLKLYSVSICRHVFYTGEHKGQRCPNS